MASAHAALERQERQAVLRTQESLDQLRVQVQGFQELEDVRLRLQEENHGLAQSLEEQRTELAKALQAKRGFERKLEEVTRSAEEATNCSQALGARSRALQVEGERLREQVDWSQEAEAEALRQLGKVRSEMALCRSRVEQELQVRMEEQEEERRQSRARLGEAEEMLAAEVARAEGLERAKVKIGAEVMELEAALEKARAAIAGLERRSRSEEQLVREWRTRAEGLGPLLETARREAREGTEEADLLRKREQELEAECGRLRREVQGLAREGAELQTRGEEARRRLEEAERGRRGLEGERRELTVALEEAESELERAEGRLVQSEVEVDQARAEGERRMAEVEEEAERVIRGAQGKLEMAQEELEVERRARIEELRSRKKLEGDVTGLEVALDLARKQAAEQGASTRRWELRCKEVQGRAEEEARVGEVAREALAVVERKVEALTEELEDSRVVASQETRTRRGLEAEVGELGEQVVVLKTGQDTQAAAKRRLEEEMVALQGELEEVAGGRRVAEERWREEVAQVARLREESRGGREAALKEDATRRSVEAQTREAVLRAEEAEAALLRARGAGTEQLEARVRWLEAELEAEKQRAGVMVRTFRQADKGRREAEAELEGMGRRVEGLQVGAMCFSTCHLSSGTGWEIAR